jgi:hypothetical protein
MATASGRGFCGSPTSPRSPYRPFFFGPGFFACGSCVRGMSITRPSISMATIARTTPSGGRIAPREADAAQIEASGQKPRSK